MKRVWLALLLVIMSSALALAGTAVHRNGVKIMPPLEIDQNVETLAAARTILVTDKAVQRLDPDGSDRDVTLPAEASSTDMVFWIYNTANGAGEDLTIKNDAPATIVNLAPGMGMMFTCDGTDWVAMGDDGITYDAQAGTHDFGASDITTTGGLLAATLETEHTAPTLTLDNTTEQDTDEGRISRIIAKGEKADGTAHSLGEIVFSHDGTGDDYKGQIQWKYNDGNDADGALQTGMTMLSNGNVGIGTVSPLSELDVAGTLAITGVGAWLNDTSQLYNSAANGLIIAGKQGSVNDFALAEAGGNMLMTNPAGTDFIAFPVSNVGIGTTSPSEKCTIKGATADGSTYPFGIEDSGAVEVFKIDSDGGIVYSGKTIVGNESVTCSSDVCAYASSVTSSYYTTEANAAADVLTVSDGTAGQRRTFVLKTDGGDDLEVTPSNFANGTKVTLDTAGESVTLEFDGANWFMVATYGGVVS